MGILLLKLGFLFVKFTAIKGSKPFMNFALERGKNHPNFVDKIMIPIANFHVGLENKLKMWVLDKYGTPAKLEILNREQSIELSTYMIAELTSVCIAAYFILIAYWRSAEKALKKEEEEQEEYDDLWRKVDYLKDVKNKQREELKELEQAIDTMSSRVFSTFV